MHVLVACASPRESEGLSIPTLVLGVGKSAAAAAMARTLASSRPDCVLLFGVCGSYPSASPDALSVGDLVVVGSETFGDEGAETEAGFLSLDDLELGTVGPFEGLSELSETAAELLSVPIVRGATVSACSATDAGAQELALRTGAAVETMEGAAVAIACAAAGVPWVQVRCVSNRTGDRSKAGWALEDAVRRVQGAVGVLLEAWSA